MDPSRRADRGAEVPAAPAPRRVRLLVQGLVQGVGFRPHVWRLAARDGLTGFALNDQDGVTIEVQGDSDAFVRDLVALAPPLARVDRVTAEPLPARDGEVGFELRDSLRAGPARTAIGPDAAICDACLAELFDPASRRYLHPFITCTHCGPRFTIARRLPYDRATTSMAEFPLCPACATEYANPANRRFHAETICCPDCGPRLGMTMEQVAQRVRAGQIVALKGIGGFHLVCDARDDTIVARLRTRKRRDGKPFAVMVANLASAQRFAEIGPAEARLMQDRARPVVVVPARVRAALAAGVSNGLPTVGLFLPYAPTHWLLFWELLGRPPGTDWTREANDLALVATSANLSGEPIVVDGAEAHTHLAGVADAIADHDRPIATRADDSVTRIVAGAPAFVRRARGFVPWPIKLVSNGPPVVALGGQLKATVAVLRGREAFVSQHVGDLDTSAAIGFLEETLHHMLAILEVAPAAVACDGHPDFASSLLAGRLGVPVVPVQHHHAHIAALAAEHGVEGPLLGISLDGYGLGADGGAWGGELLLVDGVRCERLGHLAPLAAPGGDRAAREPWRMAAAALHRLGRADEIERRFAAEPLAGAVRRLLDSGTASAPTSSCGRLFDAVAGLLGVSSRQSFEGEAAMRLEGLVSRVAVLPEGWRIAGDVLDLSRLLERLADESDPVRGADLFHGTLIAALADWAEAAAARTGLRRVALGGGCFLNRVLTEGVAARFAARGLEALIARAVPPNDGGVALGQAYVARATTDGH